MRRKSKKQLKIAIGFIVIFIALFLIYSWNADSSFLENINPSNLISNYENVEGISSNYCDENIKIDKIYFSDVKNFYPMIKYSEKSCDENQKACINTKKITWKDGTPISVSKSKIYQPMLLSKQIDPLCRKGTKEGENFNHFYCENLGYKKQIKYSTGEIGPTHHYSIDLVLDMSEASSEEFQTTFGVEDHMVRHYIFPIKEFNCEKISKEEYNHEVV